MPNSFCRYSLSVSRFSPVSSSLLSPDWDWIAYYSGDIWRTMNNQDCFVVAPFRPGRTISEGEGKSLDCCLGCVQTALSWSPDSEYLVTAYEFWEGLQFYRVPWGSTSSDDEKGYAAAWSPDMTKIAIVRSDGVCLYDWNGNLHNEVNLGLPSSQDSYFGSVPSWSPDGMRITFASNHAGNWEVYVVDRDGSNLVNLTDTPEDEFNPVWSPHVKAASVVEDKGWGRIKTETR